MTYNEFRKLVRETLEGNDELLKKLFPSSNEIASADKGIVSNGDMSGDDSTALSENNDSNGTLATGTNGNYMADRDLLNSIARLEAELAEQKSKHEKEIYNLEQQIEVWKDRNKKRLEIEQELAGSHETIEKLKSQLNDQQQLVNQLLDEREKASKDYQEVLNRITAQQEEKANLAANNDSLNQRMQGLQKQISSITQMRDKLRKDTVELNKRISELEKNEENLKNTLEQYKQYKENLDSMTENLDILQKTHKSTLFQLASAQNENTQLKETVRDLETIKQKLESAERKVIRLTQANNENTRQVTQLNELNHSLQRQVDETAKKLIHYFVESTLSSWATKLIMEDYAMMSQEAARVPSLLSRLETAEAEVSKLQLKIKDTKTEYLLQLKKNKNLIQELKAQYQVLQQQCELLKRDKNQDMVKPSPRRVESLQDLPLGSLSSIDSPRSSSRRINSISSARSHSRTNSDSLMGTPSPRSLPDVDEQLSTSVQALLDQLQKDNNMLLTKVAELQENKWKLTERVRFLEESNMLMQEDLEKKQTIIQHYIERERTGRVAPEQERWNQSTKKKDLQSNGTAAISMEAYKHMQQVMQETLLHNIQLQKDIRTLGSEIARLQDKIRSVEAQNITTAS